MPRMPGTCLAASTAAGVSQMMMEAPEWVRMRAISGAVNRVLIPTVTRLAFHAPWKAVTM